MKPILHLHLLGGFLLVINDVPITTIDWPRMQSLLAFLVLHCDTPHLRALEHLVLAFEKEHLYQDAISAAHQLLRYDPLHEATYRHLMRLYAGSGDRAAALRTYHSCITVLQRELATEPSPPTQEVYQRLLQKDTTSLPMVSPTTSLAGVAPLVDRQSEWAKLQDIWQRTLTGQSYMVVISGEAGIGKTRLAEEFVTWINRQGLANANAYCYPAEGELTYAPIAAWLRADAIKPTLGKLADPWLTEVARFLPEVLAERPDLHPAPLRESWQRQRLFEAFARAIFGVRQPLLLLLEDLQWCDHETLQWLHYLLRFDAHAPVLIVGTMRPEEISASHPLAALLKILRSRRQVTEISLGPLNDVETASLATHVSRKDLGANMAANLYRETEGNPLFIVETMRMREGSPMERKHLASRDPIAASATIQAVMAARLEHLSPESYELVSQAAVLGRAFTFQVLKQASRYDDDTLVQGLDELWQRRIIREQEVDAYDFSHDKLRAVVYTSLSTARRRLLHRRAADALQMIYADGLDSVSGLIATHYEQAGVIERAIIYYQRAAEVAQHVYANEDAILSYQRASALLKTGSSLQSSQWREMSMHIYENLGDILTLIARFDEARKAYQEALVQVSGSAHVQRAQLHRKIALTWKTQRNFDEGLHVYSLAETALEDGFGEHTPEWWQVWIDIQSDRIEICYWQARLDEMQDLIEKTQPVVEHHGTQIQRASFFQSLFMMNIRRERYLVSSKTLEYARLSLAARLELESQTAIAWARFNLGFAYLWHGDLDMAEEQLQVTKQISEQTGDMTLQSRNLTYLTVLARMRGQIEETRRIASLALAAATELQLPEYIAMAQANLAWVAWREGKHLDAYGEGLAALSLWRSLPTPYMFLWAGLWLLISVELMRNRLTEATDHAHLLLDPQQSALPDALETLVKAGLQSWDVGQLEAARTHLCQATALAQKMGYL
jgi:tetratricopeptide (TPR) repeat protein